MSQKYATKIRWGGEGGGGGGGILVLKGERSFGKIPFTNFQKPIFFNAFGTDLVQLTQQLDCLFLTKI